VKICLASALSGLVLTNYSRFALESHLEFDMIRISGIFISVPQLNIW